MATIRKLPSGKYRADIRYQTKHIKNKTFTSHVDAVEWAEKYERNIQKILNYKPKKLTKLSPVKIDKLGGIELFNKLGVDVDILTFHELANVYFNGFTDRHGYKISGWQGKDWINQQARVHYWAEVFGYTPVKSISPDNVRKHINEYAAGTVRKGNGVGRSIATNNSRSANTVKRQLAVLSSIFRFAVDNELSDTNPCNVIRVKSTPNQKDRFLTDDERPRLLEACKQSSWDKLHLLVSLAMTTGMRRSELLGLRWSDIDFERNTAVLSDSKNGEKRINAIPSGVVRELGQFREIGTGLIFSASGTNKPFNFRRQFLIALDKASIEKFTFHCLRHTCASYLINNGVTLEQTGQILGHKSVQTTRRYAHLSTEKKSYAIEETMRHILTTN